MSSRRILVTVDEVRLHGFDPVQVSAVKDALAEALHDRFATGTGVLRDRHHARLDGGTFPLESNAQPAALAVGIATRVHRAMEKPC